MAIDIGVRKVVEFLASHPLLVLAALALYFIVFVVAVLFYGKKSGRNPFDLNKDFRRPPEPFVHDPKARDAILKQRFKPAKVPENLDAIVIGSGIGGLSTAAVLSRAGKKVLVLEQHDQAGGCCHTFVEKGFEFDTGIHYIGHMEDGQTNRTLLDQLTCGQLRWGRMDDTFDTVVVGEGDKAKRYPMVSGEKRYQQNLLDRFPQEKEAIEKYIHLISDASNSFLGVLILKVLPRKVVWFLIKTGLYRLVCSCYKKGYVDRSLQDVLDSLTDNKELKTVLSYICGDYGEAPKNVSFLLHAMVVAHYFDGAYYPRGGSSEIAFHIVQTIQKAGGRVLVQAPVSSILCNTSGRAVGVKVGGKTETDIYAKYIVSDAGITNTFKHLLPEEIAKRSCIYPLTESVGPSISFLTTFFGLEGSSKELNLPAGNYWVYRGNDISEMYIDFFKTNIEDVEDAPIPFAYISFPSAKDTEWEDKYPEKSTMIIITLSKYEWFEEWQDDKVRGRGDRYEGVKDTLGRRLWEICLDNFPQLDGKCLYTEVGTPVTNRFYLGFSKGEMYGLSQGLSRFSPDIASKLRPDTDIPGLYLTGQDTLTCGFTAALISGVLTCSAILNRNCYSDLKKLNKQDKAQLKAATNGEAKKVD